MIGTVERTRSISPLVVVIVVVVSKLIRGTREVGERKKKGATTQLSAIYRNPRCAAESLATFKRGYRRHHSHAATIVSLIFYVLSASGICGGRESRFVWKLSKQEFNVGKMMRMMETINSFFFLLEDTIYLRDKIFLL